MKYFSVKRLIDRSEVLDGLQGRFDAVHGLKDPGERLLKYQKLADDCDDIYRNVDNTSKAIAAPGVLGGIALLVGGALAVNPLVAGAGCVLVFGGMAAQVSLGGDAKNGACELRDRSCAAVASIISDAPLASIAKSPHFDQVMLSFPTLKDKFLLAASREKFCETAAPQTNPPKLVL